MRAADARSWTSWLGSTAPPDSVMSWLETAREDSLRPTLPTASRQKLLGALEYWKRANRDPDPLSEDESAPGNSEPDAWTDTLLRAFTRERDPFLHQRRAYQVLRWGSFRGHAKDRPGWGRLEATLRQAVRNGPDRTFRLRAEALLGRSQEEVFDALPAWKTTVVAGFQPESDQQWQAMLDSAPVPAKCFLWLLTGLRSGDEIEALKQILALDPTSPRTLVLLFRSLQQRESGAREWFPREPDDSVLAGLARRALGRADTPHRWLWRVALARLSADPDSALSQILAARSERAIPPGGQWQLDAEEAFFRARLARSPDDSHTIRLLALLRSPSLQDRTVPSAESWNPAPMPVRWSHHLAGILSTCRYGDPLLVQALRHRVPADPDSLVHLSTALPASRDSLVSWARSRVDRDRHFWSAALSHAFFRAGRFTQARNAWAPFRTLDATELPHDPFDIPWPETRSGVPAPQNLTRMRLLDSLAVLETLATRRGRAGAHAALLLAAASHRLTDFGNYPDFVGFVEHTTDTALLEAGLRHALRAERDLPEAEQRALAAVLAARLERDLQWARGGCRVAEGYWSTWTGCQELSIARQAFARIRKRHEKTTTGKRFLQECSFYRDWRDEASPRP